MLMDTPRVKECSAPFPWDLVWLGVATLIGVAFGVFWTLRGLH